MSVLRSLLHLFHIPGWTARRSVQPAKEQARGHFVHGMERELYYVRFDKPYQADDLSASLTGPDSLDKAPET
ncbi:hypothetical protein YO5_02026 [Stutzerimonas stutzeri TS44]|nr:hypothetical protein YO5_02026 [Stutzerimonas stutzeri TS44]